MKLTTFLILISVISVFAGKTYSRTKLINLNLKNSTVKEVLQQNTVSGTVTDESGQPLPGVTIVVKGTTQGTITDTNGNYSLPNVPEGAVLVFSFVGMKTQEIPVKNQSSINLQMEVDAIGIDEVVAIGYGTQKKVNLTGSISTVGGEDLMKRPVNNPLSALQGLATGLQITQESGQPGNERIKIQIRGMGTFSGAGRNPLIIIDGIAGDINALNPNDIESISVLKDAASSAIYGSRAANGVILVKTKTGKQGKLKVTYNGAVSAQSPAIIPEVITNSVEYMELVNTAIDNSNGSPKEKYSQSIIDDYRNNVGNPQYPNTNWYDLVSRTAIVHNHHLSISGGDGNTQYNFGVGMLDQDGIIKATSMKKYNVLLNIDSKVNKYLDFGVNLSLSNRDQKSSYEDGSQIFNSVYAARPTYSPYLLDDPTKYSDAAFVFEKTNKNPVMVIENGFKNNTDYNALLKGYLRFNITNDLNLLVNGAITYADLTYDYQKPEMKKYLFSTGEFTGYQNSTTELQKDRTRNILTTFYSTLNYHKIINDSHELNGVLGYSQEDFSNEYLQASREGFPSPALTVLDAGDAESQFNKGSGYGWAIQSVFGRVNYGFKGKYLLESTFRYDGSSRFAKGNRWGFFPSVSLGWRVSEESFLQNAASWVSNLKIRASYGTLGNQDIGYYPYQDLISTNILYPFGSTVSPGAFVGALANRDISWEKTTQADIGFDLSLTNRLFYATFDYFDKLTTDILRAQQIPDYLGLSGPTVNGGELRNTGFELLLGHSNSFGDFRYDVNANISTYKNKLEKYGTREIGSGAFGSKVLREEGKPWDSYYTLEWIGIFQSDEEVANSPAQPYNPVAGDLKFKDQNGDKVIDDKDLTVIDGKFPKANYGFNIFLGWKNFDLSAFFYGTYGKKVLGVKHGADPFFQGGPPEVSWRDAWTPENHSATLPKIYYARNGYQPAQQISSFWLLNANYLRFKNLQVGYNLSSLFPNNQIVSNARIYFSGDNILTFTKMQFGGEPERSEDDRNTFYPQIKSYSLGVRIEF